MICVLNDKTSNTIKWIVILTKKISPKAMNQAVLKSLLTLNWSAYNKCAFKTITSSTDLTDFPIKTSFLSKNIKFYQTN